MMVVDNLSATYIDVDFERWCPLATGEPGQEVPTSA